GDYTASALVAIGMNKPELAIDANIERVIARYYGLGDIKGPKLHKAVRALFEAGELLPEHVSPRDFNEALMDIGRVFCQARKAECTFCPISDGCFARLSQEPLAFPNVESLAKKSEKIQATLIRVISLDSKGRIHGIRRKSHEWLAGQIDLPTFVYACDEDGFDRYPLWQKNLPSITFKLKSTITKYNFENLVVYSKLDGLETFELNPKAVNFSSVTLKILRELSLV